LDDAIGQPCFARWRCDWGMPARQMRRASSVTKHARTQTICYAEQCCGRGTLPQARLRPHRASARGGSSPSPTLYTRMASRTL
jgi:hypothetical protein